MKIAHVCPFYAPAICGVKQVVQELSERYVKEGHEVHVFTSDWDKEERIDKKEEILNGVHIHRCFHWFRVVNFINFWPSVFWKLWEQDFDVVHTHLSFHPHSFLAALICKLKKIPHVHTTHCPWTEENRNFLGKIIKSISKFTYVKWLYQMSDKIIAITPWEIQFIKEFGGDEKKIITLPNGMDNLFFKKTERKFFKREFGIDKKVILFFARYNKTKSPQNFVLMAKEILKKRKDIAFVMIGPDEGEYKNTKNLVKGEKDIYVLGPVRGKEKIAEMYQSSEIYVLPSFREGLPLTLFEAMASGLPIVATSVNGIPYEMENNVNGFLVEWNDIIGLAKSVIKILENRSLSQKFKKNNIQKAKKYSWDIITKKTLNLYASLLKK